MAPISNSQYMCSICWDDLKYPEPSDHEAILGCGHVYHKQCINGWMDTLLNKSMSLTCPYDRSEIVTYNEEKIEDPFAGHDDYESEPDLEPMESNFGFMIDFW